MDAVVTSWVLYSIREVFGLGNVRNILLSNMIKSDYKIKYGKTFSFESSIEDIYNYVLVFLLEKNYDYLIFTANNSVKMTNETVDNTEIESHYQTFILSCSKVIIIDPSRKQGKDGIYNPYIGKKMERFFKKIKIKIEWLETTNPCQELEEDVFCQTWTLFLAIKYFEKNLYIPKEQEEKYALLLNFLKTCLKNYAFCKELYISYNDATKENKLNKYNPCTYLENMNTKDMYA